MKLVLTRELGKGVKQICRFWVIYDFIFYIFIN